ncbi:unnamed protein product [Effrenium voratum]|uniref:Uncharacterized protein n=1 Tax=Effrenium voratum TaxID=2562239 RepID=A0AA36JGB0_9DINO|nr:unnamed protein product [Effrenium voratum]
MANRHLRQTKKTYPRYDLQLVSTAALIAMCGHEVMGLIATYMGAQQTQALIPHLKSRCLPSFLLALMFGVLATAERGFSRSEWTVAHVMPSADGLTAAGRPVYTMQYMEWGINVPILFILSGYCSLGRPISEISRPLVVTNIYVIFCWAATATDSGLLKWLLIAVSFAMYAWASVDMLGWVSEFERAAPRDLPSRSIRPWLSNGLILHFMLYGVVYMSSVMGLIDAQTERKGFFVLTFGAKIAYCAAFVVERLQLGMISICAEASTSTSRACLDGAGRCKLRPRAPDMEKLEKILGCHVAGANLKDLLAGEEDRADFSAYVRNVVRQADSPQAFSEATLTTGGGWSCGASMPPIAQVLHSKMKAKGPQMNATLHLSVVPRSAVEQWEGAAPGGASPVLGDGAGGHGGGPGNGGLEARIVGAVGATTSKALGAYSQRIEFQNDCIHASITVMGQTLEGRFRMNCSTEPYQLDIEVLAKGSSCPPPAIPYIFKFQDGRLHLCGPADGRMHRPSNFDGPGLCVMDRAGGLTTMPTMPKSDRRDRLETRSVRSAGVFEPDPEFSRNSTEEPPQKPAQIAQIAEKPAQKLSGVVNWVEEKPAVAASAALALTSVILALRKSLCTDVRVLATLLRSALAGRPVYTMQYMEWGINVPILFILSGYCSLGRPISEISRPLVVTNIYVIFCWAATATDSGLLKWLLIAVSFAMYAWASVDMLGWVSEFERAAPRDLPSRSIRPWLSNGLILHFMLYGVVYMSSVMGLIDAQTERKGFFVLTFGAKIAYCAAFVFIRADEYHKTLTDVLRKVSVSNVGMISILRGSFDIILPCVLDGAGRCKLPPQISGDMEKLEKILGCHVAGANLKDLLAGEEDRADFSAYVRNVVPPGLASKMAKGPQMNATLHLSVVPRSAVSMGKERHLVAAIQFSATVPEDKEADLGTGFESFKHDDAYASTGGSTHPPTDSGSSGIVANLADLNKLGASALLHGSVEASDTGSMYWGPSMVSDETMSHLGAFMEKAALGTVAFDARIVGAWEGTTSKALGAYSQRIEFQNDCIHASITVIGQTLEGRFRMNCSTEPYQLDIEVLPKGSSCPPPAIPYIFKFQDGRLHLCGPADGRMHRPSNFDGPGLCVMDRAGGLITMPTMPKSDRRDRLETRSVRSAGVFEPDPEFSRNSTEEPPQKPAQIAQIAEKPAQKLSGVVNWVEEKPAVAASAALALTSVILALRKSL